MLRSNKSHCLLANTMFKQGDYADDTGQKWVGHYIGIEMSPKLKIAFRLAIIFFCMIVNQYHQMAQWVNFRNPRVTHITDVKCKDMNVKHLLFLWFGLDRCLMTKL